jgi:hypothetical protein
MQSNSIKAFILSRPSKNRSWSILTGSLQYRGSNNSGLYNECKYTRPFVYGFKTLSLAQYWRDLYATDSYEFLSESYGENNEIELMFKKKNLETSIHNKTETYTYLEQLYFNKVREQIEIESLDDVDEELLRRIVLCYYMMFVYVVDAHRKDHNTLILKGVQINPFDHIENDPIEIQNMVIDTLELNYYI